MKITYKYLIGDSLHIVCKKGDRNRKRKYAKAIEKIENMTNYPNDFFIFDLYEDDMLDKVNDKVVFFQTTKTGILGKVDYYQVEIRINRNYESHMYMRYEKKDAVIALFKQICMDGEMPDLSEWKDLSEDNSYRMDVKVESDPEYEKYKRARKVCSAQTICSDDPFDNVRYRKALTFLVKNGDSCGQLDRSYMLCDDYAADFEYGKIRKLIDEYSYDLEIVECMGDIEYYGYTDKPNHKKAYGYYKHATACGNLSAQVKLAKMFKNGAYVKPNFGTYKKLILDAYEKINKYGNFWMLPEVLVERAKIMFDSGDFDSGVDDVVMAIRIFTSNLMNGLLRAEGLLDAIELLYRNAYCDADSLTVNKVLFLIKIPIEIFMVMDGVGHTVKSYYENGRYVIDFDGQLFSGRKKFLIDAKIGNKMFRECLGRFDYAEVVRYGELSGEA